MNIFLTELTRNIPLSFFKTSFDPFLGMVVTVAFLINAGISFLVFMLLNSFNIDNLRLDPTIELGQSASLFTFLANHNPAEQQNIVGL